MSDLLGLPVVRC